MHEAVEPDEELPELLLELLEDELMELLDPPPPHDARKAAAPPEASHVSI